MQTELISIFVHCMHVMSQIEDIYKQLGGDLPSADFNLESSEDEVRVHSFYLAPIGNTLSSKSFIPAVAVCKIVCFRL